MTKLKIEIKYQVPPEHQAWHHYLMKSVAPIPFCDGEIVPHSPPRTTRGSSYAYMWMLASLSDVVAKNQRLKPLTVFFPYQGPHLIIRQPNRPDERDFCTQQFLDRIGQMPAGLAVRLNRDMANAIYHYVLCNPRSYQTSVKALLGFQKEISNQLASMTYEEIVRRNIVKKSWG